jgi:hypothetical protein
MSDPLLVSPYLCQPPLDYRDFLDEQITRLEVERQRIDDRLLMLRRERERLGSRIIESTFSLTIS